MDAKQRDSTALVEDINPEIEWVADEDCDIARVYVPGFRKDQLRVQLTKARNLIISGERLVEDNKWSRFRKEFPISINCDTNKISAKFEGGTLLVKQPKLIIPADQDKSDKNNKPPTTSEVPKPPQKLMEEPQPKNSNENSNDSKIVSEKSPEMKKPEIANGVPNDSKKSPEMKADIANDVPEKTPKEKIEYTAEKHEDDYVNNAAKVDEEFTGDVSSSGKNSVDKHRQAVGVLATKLKMPRRVMNLGIAILVALVLGLYLASSIRSWTEAEK